MRTRAFQRRAARPQRPRARRAAVGERSSQSRGRRKQSLSLQATPLSTHCACRSAACCRTRSSARLRWRRCGRGSAPRQNETRARRSTACITRRPASAAPCSAGPVRGPTAGLPAAAGRPPVVRPRPLERTSRQSTSRQSRGRVARGGGGCAGLLCERRDRCGAVERAKGADSGSDRQTDSETTQRQRQARRGIAPPRRLRRRPRLRRTSRARRAGRRASPPQR